MEIERHLDCNGPESLRDTNNLQTGSAATQVSAASNIGRFALIGNRMKRTLAPPKTSSECSEIFLLARPDHLSGRYKSLHKAPTGPKTGIQHGALIDGLSLYRSDGKLCVVQFYEERWAEKRIPLKRPEAEDEYSIFRKIPARESGLAVTCPGVLADVANFVVVIATQFKAIERC